MQETLLKQATLGLGDVASSEYWKTLQLSGADSLRDFATATPEKSDAPEFAARETCATMSHEKANELLRWSSSELYYDYYNLSKKLDAIGVQGLRAPSDLVVDVVLELDKKLCFSRAETGGGISYEAFVGEIGGKAPDAYVKRATVLATLFGAAGRNTIVERGGCERFQKMFYYAPFGDVDLLDELERAFYRDKEAYEADEILAMFRYRDPRRARQCLESTWDKMKTTRVACVRALLVGLSNEDVPFLESLMEGRSQELRRVAVPYLMRLSQSKYARLIAERADEVLTDSGLVLPQSSKAAKELDKLGLKLDKNDKTWANFSQDERLAIALLSAVPLTHWEERFKLSLRELAAKFPFADQNLPVVIGWIRSSVRFGCSIEQLKVVYSYLLDSYEKLPKRDEKTSAARDALPGLLVRDGVCNFKKSGTFGHFDAQFDRLVQRVAGRRFVLDRDEVADWLAEE